MMEKISRRKFPTLIGILIILAGIFVTIYLVKNGYRFLISAGPGGNPENVEITNIGDTSFTLSYITDDKVAGTLKYGTDPARLDTLVLDDRDQLSSSVNEYNVHSISVKGLNPDSTYYFNIISADKTYSNNGSLYNVKTGPVVAADPSDKEPLSGKVILPDGSNPEEALVYLTTAGAQKLSGYLKKDGNYVIPLNTLRNESLNDYFALDQDSIINIEIATGKLFSSVSLSSDEVNPVPLITLSNNYDFSGGENKEDKQELENEVSFPTVSMLSPTQTPILTPGPTLTLTPTPQPPTLTPTATLTPAPTAPAPTIPPTGTSSVIITAAAGALTVVAGIILFFLTRGQIL